MDESTEKEVARIMEQYNRPMQDPTVVQMQLDMSEQINLLEHDFRGEWFDFKAQEWKPSGMRMMNDEGVRALIGIMHNYLTPNTWLSNLNDSDIEKIMKPFHLKLAALLVDKQEEWEIEDAYMRITVQKMTDTTLLAMKRSLFHKTLDALSQSSKFYEQREIAPKKGKGPLNWFR